ncbi:LapA family protein [Gemmatimonadota bacterium]
MKYKVFAGIVLLLLVILFTIQNAELTTVKFLLWELQFSRALLLFVVFASGILIGWVLGSIYKPK